MPRVIRAAGGLVMDKTGKGELKVLLAHRPAYDDWGLPKGKIDDLEEPEAAAVREVLEETGYHCRIVAPLGTTSHRVEGGVKEVSWFAMRPLPDSTGFRKNPETDEVRWVAAKEAKELLDYENDRALLEGADLRGLAQTGTIRLLRHASAGDRSSWDGDDTKRPLTKKGRRQSKAIAESLVGAGIDRIVSSPFTRCVESVKPLAKATEAKIETNEALSEEPDIDAAHDLFDSLVGYNAVLCSHGDVIPALVNRLMWAGLSLESRFYCSKGSIWEIDLESGKLTVGRYIPPPEI